MQDQISQNKKNTNSHRQFSTFARHSTSGQRGSSQGVDGLHGQEGSSASDTDQVASMMSDAVEQNRQQLPEGFKFPLPPNLPRTSKTENFRSRYDSVLDQFTKQLMFSGKLAKAQKVYTLYTLIPPIRRRREMTLLT